MTPLQFQLSPASLLAQLNRNPSANDSAQIARVFEVFLEKSRFGLDQNQSGQSLLNLGTSNSGSTDLQRKLLDWAAKRFAPTSTPSQSKINLPGAYAQSTLVEKPVHPNVPRSIPLLANKAAEHHGVPQRLFRRMIWVESEFNPKAVSPKGAMGLGQLMPDTARELGLDLKLKSGEGSVWDPKSNLDASARYMKWLHEQFVEKGIEEREAWRFSAAAYNAGIGNISRAMDRIGKHGAVSWERVSDHLPQITGRASGETFHYMERLRI